jgi:hypothetical protein
MADPPEQQPLPQTPGWRFVHIGVEGDSVSIGGVNPWHCQWRSLSEPRIVVAHPQYPRERHEMFVHELDGPAGPIRFAAGEFSAGVWGFYVPESEAREGDA